MPNASSSGVLGLWPVCMTKLGPTSSKTTGKYIGLRYGRYVVTAFSRRKSNTEYLYYCLCDCGVGREVRISSLKQGHTKSCGCLHKDVKRHAPGSAALKNLFNRYQWEARQRGYSFELSLEQFQKITAQNCFYCDSPPFQVHGQRGYHGSIKYSGVDRVDNALGYVPDNCVPSCKPCNAAKNSISKEMIAKLYHRLFPC
jgi:hypothetical protein